MDRPVTADRRHQAPPVDPFASCPPSGMTMITGNCAEKSTTSVFSLQVANVSPAPWRR